MLTMHRCIRPAEKEIIFKVFDGEAILINAAKGICYSLENVGGLIWEMIQEAHNFKEIVRAIVARYDASPKQVEADVERLVKELIEENLVSLSNDQSSARNCPEPQQQQKLPYTSPQLTIYRDMGDLLALDPPMPGLDDIAWKEPEDKS